MKKIRNVLQETALVIITVIWMLPVYYFVISAFKDRRDIVKGPLKLDFSEMSLDNFTYVLNNTPLLRALVNTAVITVSSLLLIIIIGSMAGFALGRMQSLVFAVYYRVIVALMVVPFIGCLLTLVKLSVALKTYNSLLGCILIHVAWHLPMCTFLYTGFMKSLPQELEEAAYVDGCNVFKRYFSIFLPLLKPVTATCCIQAGLGIWNDYLVSNALLNSTRTPTLMVNVYSFFFFFVSEYGYAFASVILAALPIIILFVTLQKYFIKGLTAGAVKG